MPTMHELNRLFDAYAEDDLSAADEAALCQWLQERPEHVAMFVRETFLHSELFSLARQQYLHEGVLHRSNNEAARASGEVRLHTLPVRTKSGVSGRAASWMAAAALLLVALGLWWSAWSVMPSAVVGQLTQATADAVWQHESDVLKVGEFLHEGQRLHLVRGRALMTLGSGARVVVEGPAKLSIVDDNRLRLEKGLLGATVPTQAIGFTVDTPIGAFVDLGTEFTLDLTMAAQCKLYVFTGLVEVRPQPSGGAARPSFKVAQTQAVSYDSATDTAELIPIGEGEKLGL